MASELNKPNGISILYEQDVESKIWPLSCRKINGIGPKAEAKLQAQDIHTIGDLAAKERGWLMQHFGKSYGAWLFDAAHGVDERPVVTESEPVSMSRETTFEKDLHVVNDRAALGEIFTRLCQQVAADLQRKGYVGKTIGIKLRFDNFQSVTRDQTIDHYTADAADIRKIGGLCLKRVDMKRRLCLLGVRVGALVKADSQEALAPDAAKSVLLLREPSPPTEPHHEQADLF
jgi:DNA polymerase-4